MSDKRLVPALVAVGLAAAFPAAAQTSTATIGGTVFTNQGLVGVGRVVADMRDLRGETLGSVSAMTFDPTSWRRSGDGYSGFLFTLPDRGYNVVGTTDYTPRLQGFALSFNPYYGSAVQPQTQVALQLRSTTLLTDNNGVVMSGLDPAPGNAGGVRAATATLPALPQAPNGKISLDPEGLVRTLDGGFWISDEYGPYIYRFDAQGRMLGAIQPPAALLPMRNGQLDFRSNNPPPGTPAPVPADPTTGRQNNQGLEGLTLSADGTRLSALLQSATRQDGGNGAGTPTRKNTRLLTYDVSNVATPRLVSEYVVQLPVDSSNRVAAQSEMLALNDKQFLVLARDSGNGWGLAGSTSLYRSIDLIDTSNATNIAGTSFDGTTPVSPGGVLVASVTPVTYARFININDNAQLGKFGLHNGAPNDRNNLSEKWEALALLPVLDPKNPDDFFLFVGNDNDFLTTNGFQVGAPYSDPGGKDVDTTILVYRLTLPTYVDPLASDQLRRSALPFAQGVLETAFDMVRARTRDPGGRLFALRAGLPRDGALQLWAEGTFDRTERPGRDGAGGFKPQSAAGQAGADLQVQPGFVVGVTAGYGRGSRSIGGLGSARVGGASVGVYASAISGSFWADLAYTHVFVEADDLSRPTYYGLTARGNTSGGGDVFAANTGLNFKFDALTVGPTLGVEFANVRLDGWSESEAIHLNATLPSLTARSLTWRFGAQASYATKLGEVDVTPQLRFGWDLDQLRDERQVTAVLSNRASSVLGQATATYRRTDHDGPTAGGGVAFGFGRVSLLVDYDHAFGRSTYERDSVRGALRVSF